MKNLITKIILIISLLGNIAANAQTHIPDGNFAAAIRNYCPTCIDANDDLTAAAATLTSLDVSAYPPLGVTDMTGIIGFTNLQSLNCSYNGLTSLDVQGLTSLEYLICDNNQLTTLNIQGLINLKQLKCRNNQLTDIDLQTCTNIETLCCENNDISSLNLTNIHSLDSLWCGGYQLLSLNLYGLTDLKHLQCSAYNLSTLNVQGCITLESLYVSYTLLTSLNLQGLSNLRILSCEFNQLDGLDLQGLSNLEFLSCWANDIVMLNVSGCTSLHHIEISNNIHLVCLPYLPNSLTYLSTQNTLVTCLQNIPAGIAAANTLPICNSGCTYIALPTCTTTIPISTGIDNTGNPLAIGATDPNWHIIDTVTLATYPPLKTDSYLPYWQPTPVVGTNAGWLNISGLYNGSNPTGFFAYEREFTIGTNLNIQCNFQMAWDDDLVSLALIAPNGDITYLPFTRNATQGYFLNPTVNTTIQHAQAGTWKLRAVVNYVDAAAAFLLSGNITTIPVFYYTVDCANTITWTVPNASCYTSYTLTDQNGIDITNSTTPPQEGDLILLTCTDATGQSISTSQVFSTQGAIRPTFTYNFSNNGNTLNVITATNSLPQNLTITATPSTTAAINHTAAIPNHTYTDAFAATNTNITVCAQAVYSGFNGNPLNTVCKTLCKTIPAQNCANMAAYITGGNIQQGQPSELTALAAFTPAEPTATYTYHWNDGSTNATLIVNPTTIATYSVTVTSDRGCTATATVQLPTWDINTIDAVDSVCAYNSTPFCVSLVSNKKIVNGTGLRFKISIAGPVTIQGLPTNSVTLNNTIVTGTSYATYNNTTNITTISITPNAGTRINTGSFLPAKVACLNLALLPSAQPNDQIVIHGTVEENYIGGAYQIFGLFDATIPITGGANTLNLSLFNQNSTDMLHSPHTIITGRDNANTVLTTGVLNSVNNTFDLAVNTGTTELKIDRIVAEPLASIWSPGTNPTVIGNVDAAYTQTLSTGALFLNQTPTIYQMLAMDSDNNGRIAADDPLYISERCAGIRSDFDGRHWKFFPKAQITTDPYFQISANFPNSAVQGYSVDTLPIIPITLPMPAAYQDCDTVHVDYAGVLIGDADNSWTPTNEIVYRPLNNVLTFFLNNPLVTDAQGYYTIPIDVNINTYSVDMSLPNLPISVTDVQLINNNNGFTTTNNFQRTLNKYLGGAFMPAPGLSNRILLLKIKTTNTGDITSVLNNAVAFINGSAASTITPTENIPSSVTLSVLPNPTNSNITIRTNNTALINQQIQLYDALGRLLQSTTLQHTEQTIDLSNYPAGMYFIRIKNEVLKIVKE